MDEDQWGQLRPLVLLILDPAVVDLIAFRTGMPQGDVSEFFEMKRVKHGQWLADVGNAFPRYPVRERRRNREWKIRLPTPDRRAWNDGR